MYESRKGEVEVDLGKHEGLLKSTPLAKAEEGDTCLEYCRPTTV
jgi:hypothetical protein